MSRYLLDTNVVSELAKDPARRDASVYQWYIRRPVMDIFMSVVTFAELEKGISMIRKTNELGALKYEKWATDLYIEASSLERVLGIDYDVAKCWGKLFELRPVSILDGFLAATAIAHNLILVTRNERDFAGLGMQIFNPFTAA